MINIANITKIIHEKINESTSSEEVFFLSKLIKKLQIGIVKTVPTYTDMLSSASVDGDLYFVEDEEVLYVRDGELFASILEYRFVYSFGSNEYGQLGATGNVFFESSPSYFDNGFTDWAQVSAGSEHSLGIRANGTAWAWGNGGSGRLGDGTNISRSSPVSVDGGFSDWTQVSAGGEHSLGIRANGSILAWGFNANGALGDGTNIPRSSPVSVVGGFTDWKQVSAGGLHSLGIRANGTVWSWGFNANGPLGDGTNIPRSSPVSVVGGFTDWTQVSAGGAHSLGIRANGSILAWGFNANGELGDGTNIRRSSPVSVVGGFTDWAQVSAGNVHSIGLRTNGTAWAWGFNASGQLGDGTTTIRRSSPVSVVGGFTDWVSIAAGSFHTVAIRSNGTVWSCGFNANGALGDGTNISRNSPVSVVGGFTDWVSIDAGSAHSIGIRGVT